MPEEIPIARATEAVGAKGSKALDQSSLVGSAFDEDILSDIENRLSGGGEDLSADYSPRDKVELDKADLPLEFDLPPEEPESEPPEVEVDLAIEEPEPEPEAPPPQPNFIKDNLHWIAAGGSLLILLVVLAAWMIAGPTAPEPKLPTPWIYNGKVPDPDASLRLDLDPFLVQLASGGGDRILKVSVSLEVMKPEDMPSLRGSLLACRDVVYRTLSQKNLAELSTPDGKDRARALILAGINQVMGGRKVHRVYFTKFLIEG